MDQARTAGSIAASEISSLLKARNPLIWITTTEEGRTERYLLEAAAAANYIPRFWDCAQGVTDYAGVPTDQGTAAADPGTVLATISRSQSRCLWILRDLPDAWLRDPTIKRALRNLARTLAMAPKDSARSIIILSPSSEIPPELAGHAIAYEWPLPNRPEIAALLDAAIAALPDELKVTAAPNGTRDAAIDAAVGLTEEEAQSCYARSLVQLRRIDPATVAQEKRRVITREKVLEWFDPLPGGLDAVGGLNALKAWLELRRAAFGPRARAYGLPAPKGALLVGVPGCGKSLTAKAIATAWAMPLLRLDMGALKSKWIGESEGNIRKALQVAETVAPCVLWLDEIEKALAGATQGAADGGVSADALGSILSWMQDRQGSVFVVATANDVSALPPELLRKGRFDELFFVDLPSATERAAILRAALRNASIDATDIGIEYVADATQDFTGAELAALVPDAMYAAFADSERSIRTADLTAAAAATVPLARTAPEKIAALRQWAKGRARPASTTSTAAQEGTARALDL